MRLLNYSLDFFSFFFSVLRKWEEGAFIQNFGHWRIRYWKDEYNQTLCSPVFLTALQGNCILFLFIEKKTKKKYLIIIQNVHVIKNVSFLKYFFPIMHVFLKNVSRLKLYLPRQKWTRSETKIFLKIVPLAFNAFIPVNLPQVKTPKLLFWYYVKLAPWQFLKYLPCL